MHADTFVSTVLLTTDMFDQPAQNEMYIITFVNILTASTTKKYYLNQHLYKGT